MCDLRGKLLSTNGTQNKSFLCEVVHFGYHSLVMITKWACKHCINLRGDLFWWGFTGLSFSHSENIILYFLSSLPRTSGLSGVVRIR